jgi:hypothetical protein
VFTAAEPVELTALELVTTDCELELTAEEEAADEEITKLALLDWVLETADTDDELAACAGAAYKLTSVVSSSLA